MNKKFVAGAVVMALSAVPAMGVFADHVDTINVTVSGNCTLTRQAYTTGGVTNNTSHKNGTDGTWSTTANTDTLSVSMANGTVNENLGSSQFKVVCNNLNGYTVSVATTSLSVASGSQTPIPNNTTYDATTSGWSPIVGTTKLTNGGTVKTEATTTAGTTFEVKYGVGISPAQAAGTYSGTATYSISQL